MRFDIGEIAVDVVVDDDDFELPLGEFLPGLERPGRREHRGLLEPDFPRSRPRCPAMRDSDLRLRLAGRTILVDTCIGEHKNRPEIPAWNRRSKSGFLDRLRRAGVNPAAVDTVFCTHLHIDHVGWNTCRRIFAAGAGCMCATPAPASRRSSRMPRDDLGAAQAAEGGRQADR